MNTRLLITGVPGTGKTCLGEYLQSAHGFVHIDLETDTAIRSLLANRERFLAQLLEPVVITWGFPPAFGKDHVLYIKNRGFTLVWLDGDRTASYKAFMKRGTVPEGPYHAQVENIDQTQIVKQIAPHAVMNPFKENGEFRLREEIAQEVLRVGVEKREWPPNQAL